MPDVELGDADARLRRRYVNCRHDDDGSVLIEARLPAEEGELVLAAMSAARDHREPARHNAAAGLGITCENCVPDWGCSRVRHADVVERLVRMDSRFPAD